MSYSRGDIYYVEKFSSYGSEQQPGRPAVIVSNDRNNEHSSTVEVVYLTTRIKPDLPTHVTVNGTGVPSTALCEQVHTVDMQRLMSFCGTCSKQEMQAIDISLMVSLGLNLSDTAVEEESSCRDTKALTELELANTELIEVKAKLGMLQQMYDNLLRQTMLPPRPCIANHFKSRTKTQRRISNGAPL